ncbi:nitronate monooxygenase [Flavobacteriaceae bacterium Ap0902]|nr:nitronate monooxygenase [Flavobacteriaceae bacterium Ap0902]
MTLQDLKTKLTLPAIVSPMFLVSGTQLVIESCKNGVLGTFPSLNGRSAEDFENMLKEITSTLNDLAEENNTTSPPYGVNLIVNKTNPRLMTDLQLCIKYKVPVIITSLGAVKDVVDAVHSYGGLVFHDVIKKRHAEKAAEAGVDGIIAVSAGAGGHAGTANPFALVEEIKSFYKGAIILAGAISHGKDIAAAITMGADFAYMGTRFIATQESLAAEGYKEMLTQSEIKDIIYTDGVSGVNANFLLPSIQQSGIALDPEKEEDFSELTGSNAKAWKDIWSAGHGVAAIDKILTTKELINQLKTEYKAALEKNAALLKHLK